MPNNCENRLLSLLSSQEWHLDRLYAEYSRHFGTIFRNYNGRMTEARKKQFQKALQGFNDDLEKTFAAQISNSFSISNLCSDDLAKSYLKGLETPERTLNKVFTTNPNAVSSFLARTAGGMNLSDRVWALTQQTQEALESVLETGVLNGRSASEMATDLKKYLKEPDRRFRRIRNEQGKLILSNPAKDYHPGRGVYRSSYKNALRLSRNEINIAYRSNDFERRKNMSFVMGHRVQLSAAHPAYDICDELQGTYPKDFRFVGWHSNCLCFTTAILLPRDKFKEYLAGGEMDQRHLVKGVPKNALDYLNNNADKLRGYKSQPYFLKDNFKFSDGKYVPQLKAAPNQLSAPSNKAVIDKFGSAKNLTEAKSNIKEVFQRNIGLEVADVIISDKADLGKVNLQVSQLNKLSKKYNISEEWDRTRPTTFKMVSGARVDGKIQPAYNTETGKMFISDANYGHRTASKTLGLDDEVRLSRATFTSASKVDRANIDIATTTHEFAHTISTFDSRIDYNIFGGKSTDKSTHTLFWNDIKKTQQSYNRELRALKKKGLIDEAKDIHLGDYANTNADEFFAEAFTEFELSSQPSKYAKEVGDIALKYFKK